MSADRTTAMSEAPHPLEAAVASLRAWAYTDSLVVLDARKLRQCLVDDVGETGAALLTEQECEEFICGAADSGEVLPELRRRFPRTDAWLEEQLT